MNTFEFGAAREHLLAMVGLLKPERRQAFEQKLQVPRDDDTPIRRHLIMMAAIGELYDGLAYGQWPPISRT